MAKTTNAELAAIKKSLAFLQAGTRRRRGRGKQCCKKTALWLAMLFSMACAALLGMAYIKETVVELKIKTVLEFLAPHRGREPIFFDFWGQNLAPRYGRQPIFSIFRARF